MKPQKWSTPDYAGSGTFRVLSGDDANPSNIRNEILMYSSQGWDLVRVDALKTEILLNFAKRDTRDETDWDYQVISETFLEPEAQQELLNTWYYNTWELVAIWSQIDSYYVSFCLRSPFPHDDQAPPWEYKVVERPVSDLQTLFDSLAPLKKQRWTYQGHLSLTEGSQPRRHGFTLVYLNRLFHEPNN